MRDLEKEKQPIKKLKLRFNWPLNRKLYLISRYLGQNAALDSKSIMKLLLNKTKVQHLVSVEPNSDEQMFLTNYFNFKSNDWLMYCYLSNDQKLYLVDPENKKPKLNGQELRFTNSNSSFLSYLGLVYFCQDQMLGQEALLSSIKTYYDKEEKDSKFTWNALSNLVKTVLQTKGNAKYALYFMVDPDMDMIMHKGRRATMDDYYYEPGAFAMALKVMHDKDGKPMKQSTKVDEYLKDQVVHLWILKSGNVINVYRYSGALEGYLRNEMYRFLDRYITDIYGQVLQNQYEINNSDRATFYQTKKNINEQTKTAMQQLSREFQGIFKGIEIDNDVDLAKLKQLVPLLKAVCQRLPRGAKLPILRFRKLRNHKALGMFAPQNNTIAVDFRITEGQAGISSFCHEYGHYLDYNLAEQPLSLKPEFRQLLIQATNIHMIAQKELDYYLTPTECFARCFEIWLIRRNLQNSLIADKSVLLRHEYSCFNGQTVDQYFDKLFNKKEDPNYGG